MSDDLRPWRRPLLLGLVALGLALAWRNRFVQDDAFISFHYARNLVEGRGLTWFGERVEGYTNFLWVLLMALGQAFGVGMEGWSYLCGLTCLSAALAGTWRLALGVYEHTWPAVAVLLGLLTHYSFLCYATGGLETMLQCALLTWSLVLAVRLTGDPDVRPGTATRLSLLLAAAVLTRPDSALPALLVAGWTLLAWRRRGRAGDLVAPLVLPFAALVGGWAAWKVGYYGSLLPNTFHAKVDADRATLAAGLLYLWRYVHAYLLWPFLLLGGLRLAIRGPAPARHGTLPRLGLPALVLLCWAL